MDLHKKFRREYNEAIARLDALEQFPDLEEFQDIWKETRLISESVNNLATKFEVRKECDCCVPVKIYALPYIEFMGIRIYTKPCLISFAKRWSGGVVYDGNWEEDNFWMTEELVEAIWNYIEANENGDDDDDTN